MKKNKLNETYDGHDGKTSTNFVLSPEMERKMRILE
jgi:hypothetical protein